MPINGSVLIDYLIDQDMPIRRIGHEISPDLASKSLSALKDRKEEIITELGDIVGEF